ncbi:MAG: ABC transporter substrate-binding protein [Anabaena sp. CoA2_C59]|nr:ABC transporter substrate-binding protein [Anabaena sp. CoA2_C59]MDJ0506658.1 ABC transporter substrate-binding protein [Nostocales cyanobacterium LE14-WE12]
MKLNPNLKPIISSLFSLALLSIQNPAIALVNQGKLENSSINLGLNITKEFTRKQPIQIATDDEY